ncbi:MAG: hypothetical protein ACPL7I_10330, partial [Myxococcota bacterium]
MLSSNSSENDKALNKIIEISENLGIVFIERDCKEVVDRLMGGGISSISESNTMVTKGFLQNIDTAVIVLGVDPPISYDEFEVIREIKKRIKEIIFVINKVDKEPVEDIEAIRKFTTDILKKEFNLENPVIFCVSAKERFEGRNSYDWNNFVHKIDEMLLNKRAIISDSYKNAIDRLTNQLKDEIDRYIQVLKEPIEKSREKVVLLNEFKKEADIFIRELGYRFQSEQDRISQLIDLAQKKFLDEKKDDINNEFESAFDRLLNEQVNSNGSYYNEIHKIAEKYVNQCIERISGDVIRYYSEFSRRYAEEINRLESKIKSILNSELSVDDSP